MPGTPKAVRAGSAPVGAAKARALACCLLLLWCSPAKPAWETTTFEVYQGAPHEDMLGWQVFEAVSPEVPLMRDVYIREIENYLYAVAKRYEALGLPDPVAGGTLQALVNGDDGEKAIRVYLYPDASSADAVGNIAWYKVHPCNGRDTRGLIFLNTVNFASDYRLNDADYNTLAHELFHASYWASTFSKTRGCVTSEKWFSEGMADAIGHYMARTLRNAQFEQELKDTRFTKNFGSRDYSYPLNQPDKGKPNEDYFTSSFWRFLAEWTYASRQSKPHPGSAPYSESYEYLAHLLDQPYNFRPNSEGLVTWLNQHMKGYRHIRAGLAGVYPQFAATYADIIQTRIGPLAVVPDTGQRLPRWLRRGFGECESAGAVGMGATVTAALEIRPNAARCFKVDVRSGTTDREVRIQVTSNDLDLLKQLHIGLLDGTDVRAPIIQSRTNGQPPHFATWTFPLLLGNRDIYIVSNVAEFPAATRSFGGTFVLGAGNWTSSMTPATAPAAPAAAPPPGSPPPTKKALAKQRLDDIVRSPADYLEPVSRVKRNGYDDAVRCDKLSLRYNLCGPQFIIKLELSPFSDVMGLAGSGQMADYSLVADWVLTPGGGLNPGVAEAMKEADQAVASMDASRIRLTLPRIEYGYTGTLSNVRIEVSKANSPDRGYVSYGPSAHHGDRVIHRPPNGTVTIEEYSHLVLQGTFAADLIDESNPGRDEAPIVAQSVSGRFYVPAPFEGDEEFAIDAEQQKEQMIQSMLKQAPFGADVMRGIIGAQGAPPQILCDEGLDDEQLQAMGFTSGCGERGGGAVAPVCTCECDLREQEAEDCERECYQPWKSCRIPDSELPDNLEAQVEMCRSALDKRDLSDSDKEFALMLFRSSPEFHRREMLKTNWCGD
jgi:hypothetical protein